MLLSSRSRLFRFLDDWGIDFAQRLDLVELSRGKIKRGSATSIQTIILVLIATVALFSIEVMRVIIVIPVIIFFVALVGRCCIDRF